jgi:hypothetical protein
MRMDFIEVLKGVWQLGQNRGYGAAIHLADVITLEGVHKLSSMPFGCGLQTGLLI